ncbi:MAG: methyltransferase domain-containing protein [Armatimonadetes bacterium]|nr:methyltransferase domain-containing protein [Armatimonadota bacterium]
MLILRRRAQAEELLDRPDVTAEDLDRSLRDLETANRLLGGRRALLPHIVPKLRDGLAVLDIGCGSGDILRLISGVAREKGATIRLVGADINAAVISIARRRCLKYADIEFVQASAESLPFADSSFDVVFASTFIHHLGPANAARALREAARVCRGRVVISDLVRSDTGWFAAWFIGKLMFGRLSRRDAPTSFRRAYTPGELSKIAASAGLSGFNMYAGWFRMTLVFDRRDVGCASASPPISTTSCRG